MAPDTGQARTVPFIAPDDSHPQGLVSVSGKFWLSARFLEMLLSRENLRLSPLGARVSAALGPRSLLRVPLGCASAVHLARQGLLSHLITFLRCLWVLPFVHLLCLVLNAKLTTFPLSPRKMNDT